MKNKIISILIAIILTGLFFGLIACIIKYSNILAPIISGFIFIFIAFQIYMVVNKILNNTKNGGNKYEQN